MNCPLCNSVNTAFFYKDKKRKFSGCNNCELIFVQPEFLPDLKNEKERYQLHENNGHDQGYRDFIGRIVPEVAKRVSTPATGLDFGCGPSPVLAGMLGSAGYSMQVYDPFFMPDPHVLKNHYQFITATEVVEHFHEPGKMFAELLNMIKSNGILAIMTRLRTADIDFSNWHYKNDFTHVAFFSQKSFQWIANQYNLELEIVLPDIVLLRKNN